MPEDNDNGLIESVEDRPDEEGEVLSSGRPCRYDPNLNTDCLQ